MAVESVTAVSAARVHEGPAGGGRRQAAVEKWKSLYAAPVGGERFNAADVDKDGIVTRHEGAAVLTPGERRAMPLMERRYDRYAGDDDLLTRQEAAAGRRFERTHADEAWRALAHWRG